MSPKKNMDKIFCTGCFKRVEDRRVLTCRLCKDQYDLDCAGVSEHRFYNTLTGEHRAAWQCDACRSKQPRGDNTNTPVRNDPDNVTQRRGGSKASPAIMDCSMADAPREGLNDTLEVTDIQTLLIEMRQFREEMRGAMKETQAQIDALRNEILEVTGRVERCEGRVGALDRRMSALEGCVAGVGEANAARLDAVERRLEAAGRRVDTGTESGEVAKLERVVSELKLELNDRDQDALLADLEIGLLPEEKGENPIHGVVVLASRMGVVLDESDIVFAERVGARPAEAGGRARRLVVRLARRRLRDDLLRAARARRTLAHADGQRVFVNERLTRTNRQLFHRAREEGRRLQWRYVWTKRGRIFARRSDGAQVFQIRTDEDLVRVFPPTTT